MSTPRGPVASSFQHTLWSRRGVSEAAILLRRAFAFVFSWYKVIIAVSLCLSTGALQHTVHTSITAAKIVSLKYFFESRYFGSDLRLARTKTAIEIRSVQNADCRLQTGYEMQTRYKMQTADWVQNAEWEFILFSWSSMFRGIHTDLRICALYCYWLTWGTALQTHTHTNKKDTTCLMTSAHPTCSPHNLFSNPHHDECTSFLNTQLRKNKIKFIPKVLKVHINRI